jgi:hypothetical protein
MLLTSSADITRYQTFLNLAKKLIEPQRHEGLKEMTNEEEVGKQIVENDKAID